MVKKRNTDVLMTAVFVHLLRDFESALGAPGAFQRPLSVLLEQGVRGFRQLDWPIWDNSDPYFLKCQLQVGSFLKRYRYKDDAYTDSELLVEAKNKFKATQQRICVPLSDDPYVFGVLQRARVLAKSILGDYSLDEHLQLCRFGKRACYGHPFNKSYLDLKLGGPLTGSLEHIAWFRDNLPSDPILSDVVRRCAKNGQPDYVVCDSLKLSFVPKSWKSLRSIKPHTLLGSYYTYGLGRLLQEKLLQAGLNINTLQNKHRLLAQVNSRTKKLATADLSAASDSITSELLRKVLPLPWYRAVMHGRTPSVVIDGERLPLYSVATMGDGHTFPLQTLVFYCLLKAIGDLEGHDAYVSVYGDDLIYPSRLHRYVSCIFPKLHLQLNMEKTYVSSSFRESCGGDYYRGVDVRPFSPEGVHQMLCQRSYLEYLYKLLNGLARRWDPVEIPGAWDYILSEIVSVQGDVFQVPPSFPDGSGLKVDRIRKGFPFAPVDYSVVSGSVQFSYLHSFPDHRVVVAQYPYYWEALRSKSDSSEVSCWDTAGEEILTWKKATTAPTHVRTRHRGRVRRLDACTPCKATANIRRQRGSTSSWT